MWTPALHQGGPWLPQGRPRLPAHLILSPGHLVRRMSTAQKVMMRLEQGLTCCPDGFAGSLAARAWLLSASLAGSVRSVEPGADSGSPARGTPGSFFPSFVWSRVPQGQLVGSRGTILGWCEPRGPPPPFQPPALHDENMQSLLLFSQDGKIRCSANSVEKKFIKSFCFRQANHPIRFSGLVGIHVA